MQIFGSIGILLLTMMIYYLLGRAFCVKCRFDPGVPEIVCIGFFFYFAVFQVIAEIMILTGQKLHLLGMVWMAVLAVLLGTAAVIVWSDRRQQDTIPQAGQQHSVITRLLFALMIAAVLCECATAVLMQRKIGWEYDDFRSDRYDVCIRRQQRSDAQPFGTAVRFVFLLYEYGMDLAADGDFGACAAKVCDRGAVRASDECGRVQLRKRSVPGRPEKDGGARDCFGCTDNFLGCV